VIVLCFRYRKLLIPYSEGELGTVVARKLERHLMKCARCRIELDGIRLVAGALCDTDSPAMEPADDLWARVSARIADESVQPARQRRFGWAGGLAAGAAAAVVVAAIGMSLLSPKTEPIVTTARHNAVPSIKTPVAANQPATKTPMALKRPDVEATVVAKQPAKPVEMAKTAPTTTLWAYKKATRNAKPVAGGSTAAGVSNRPSKGVEVAGNYARLGVGDADYARRVAPAKGAVTASAGGAVAGDRAADAFRSLEKHDYFHDTVHAATPSAPPAPASSRAPSVSGEAKRTVSGDVRANALDLSTNRVSLGHYAEAITTAPSSTSVVDDLNETEGIRTAAIFSYP
jgi:hypothetical protein